MEWKIYEEWLDITLYRQMTNLIYKLSSNEEKYKIYMQLKENDMFLEKPKVDMETAYGLHYPGEVLERIGEHLTLTKQTYRALGLALARMMPLSKRNPVSEIYDRRGSEKISGTERMAKGTEKTDRSLEN